jgi:pSer/pThr/pTyr-binding forkhead associated (FHA) protein
MNLFLNACGLRRPLQIEVEHRISRRVEIRSLDQPFAVIGRDSNCDIVLEDKQVSRRHAYLQAIGGWVFWIDLDSQLGTFAEGQAAKSGWFGGGRIIAVGPSDVRHLPEVKDSTVEAKLVPPQGSPLVWRNYGEEPLVDVTVEFLNGPSESKTWPIRRVLSLIGTARRCKFRLADRSIEPFHCAFIRTAQGLFIVDLLGGDGIRINETPARHALVRDGDMIQVGRYEMRIHEMTAGTNPQLSTSGRHDPSTVSSTSSSVPAFLPPREHLPSKAGVEILNYESSARFPLPITGDQTDLTQSVLVPLVSQFGMMQQQMFDQFQQTMTMMVQMFGKMHNSQMETIRQEFDRLNELTEEINGLKTELARMTSKQAQVSQQSATPVTTDTRPQPMNFPTKTPSKVAGDVLPEDRQSRHMDPNPKMSVPEASLGANSKPSPNASQPEAIQGDRDVIVWLHSRITSIQNEREGRWQKILKLLPGAS